ncbi:hypothetical protein M8C21_015396 [Ambrosia artemisiifolia]|uniref:NADP-dependent oxidoreductase domain-containing protein n=1 Tax=Ambrosia artemisiifolia TaxID=4212 RepID=A0AAD5C7W9_AMBAR|nr:hypothetical protein M8C21_015396 [Ambrosia artemisiifolia]
MALQLSSACNLALSHRKTKQVRAVASDDFVKVKSKEDNVVKLGGSDLKLTKLGIGAWSWGDTSYWNNFEWDVLIRCYKLRNAAWKERKKKYPEDEIAVATKFAALPWRLGRQSVLAALKDSLSRLELDSVELYQLHWPGIWGNEGYIDGLGDAVEQGLVKAVGVSNYSEKRLREAYKQLQKRGIPLASNQVNYSLIYRIPEENGVKATCDELGISLIAYSPIAQGVLTGKYTPQNIPTGPRGNIYTAEFLTELQPLLNRIKEIGQNYNKTPTQVALNWLIAQDNVIPIPGAKNAEQAKEFGGALGWSLTSDEVNELRELASKSKPVVGFPVEKL